MGGGGTPGIPGSLSPPRPPRRPRHHHHLLLLERGVPRRSGDPTPQDVYPAHGSRRRDPYTSSTSSISATNAALASGGMTHCSWRGGGSNARRRPGAGGIIDGMAEGERLDDADTGHRHQAPVRGGAALASARTRPVQHRLLSADALMRRKQAVDDRPQRPAFLDKITDTSAKLPADRAREQQAVLLEETADLVLDLPSVKAWKYPRRSLPMSRGGVAGRAQQIPRRERQRGMRSSKTRIGGRPI
jgi:hypothetical protein